MKAVGINALILNDNCEVTHIESTMIKAILNKDGQISYDDILEFNTLQEIRKYPNLQDFIDDVLNAAINEFGDEFNSFEIVGINEYDEYTWVIECTPNYGSLTYTLNDWTNKHIRFVETWLKEN